VLLLALCVILVTVVPFIFVARMMSAVTQMTAQFNQPPVIPGLSWMFLWAAVPDFVIVVGLLLGAWFTYLKSEVTLTDRRLVFRTGYLSRRSGEVPLENVESIYIFEPLIGRMCGYGTVTVTTVGAARFVLWFIGTPQEFHSMLQKAVLNAKDSSRFIPKPPKPGLRAQDDDLRYKPK
jgi:uncharacterized membrane protein YdbT with pleckstrin-like domain